jgi:hypothetical protein
MILVRHSSPAILAVFLVEFISSLHLFITVAYQVQPKAEGGDGQANRYKIAATLACFLVEFMFSLPLSLMKLT